MAKQTIRLTESEFENMIYETINEALENEGFISNIGRGMKGALGLSNDFSLGKGAKRIGQNIKQGVQNVAQNVAQGAQRRYNAAKVNYQTGKYNDQLAELQKTLTDLQQKGILHGQATDQAVKTLMTQIGRLRAGNNSKASAFSNSIR